MAQIPIEIRYDDVLLAENLTMGMMNSLRYDSFFEHFRKADTFLEEKNIHCILSVLSEGIDVYSEWVQYIKDRQWRYKIELHGESHWNYTHLTEKDAYESLARAKDKIETTFGVQVTCWYPPFGKRHFPIWTDRVCRKLFMQFDTKGRYDRIHRRFHFWNSRDRERLAELYSRYGDIITKADRRMATDTRHQR